MKNTGLTGNNRQALLLYISTVAGLGLSFVASIVNTRALPSAEYGDVRYVQNISQFISWICLFGFFLSGSRMLALSDNKERSRRIRGCLILVLLVCSAALMSVMAVCSLLYNPAMRRLMLLSLPVCAYPLLLNYMNTTPQGDNHIGRIAIARLLPVLLYIPAAYFIFRHHGATSLSMILLQWGIYSAVLVCVILSTGPSFRKLRGTFVELNAENRTYGIHLYTGSLAMVATTYLAGVTLGAFNSDNTQVAYYTLALTLTSPLAYLPGIVGTAYFRKFANEPRIPTGVFRLTILMTICSCILFVLLIKPLVLFFYPEEYSCVAKYAMWMCVGFCLHGMGDMLNRFLCSHGRGVEIRNSSFLCGLVKIVGFTLLVWLWNVNGALVTNVLASSVYLLALAHYYRKFVSDKQ